MFKVKDKFTGDILTVYDVQHRSGLNHETNCYFLVYMPLTGEWLYDFANGYKPVEAEARND